MPNVRVLLADDHALVAEALKALLEPDFEIVGTVSDGRELLELAPQTKPDVVLLDLAMPLLNGFDAGRQLKRLVPDAKIVVVTMNEDGETVHAALSEWASGYVIKSSTGAELQRAITAAVGGKQYVSTLIASREAERTAPRMPKTKALTQRQRQVLQLLAEGRTMKEAAAVLEVSERTIAFHKYRIMEEYGIRTNAGLFRFAMKQKVVAAPLSLSV
jgi:DNA-binding NarL/FixJ family response regulator